MLTLTPPGDRLLWVASGQSQPPAMQAPTPLSPRWFETTLQIDRSRAIAYRNLSDAYARAGDSARAKQAFSTYLALAPNGSGAAYAREQIDKL